MLNTYIYHQLPPTCFGVCYSIFRETITVRVYRLSAFEMLLHRLCCKVCNRTCFLNLQFCDNMYFESDVQVTVHRDKFL